MGEKMPYVTKCGLAVTLTSWPKKIYISSSLCPTAPRL